jgi:hypothetical protein
VTKSLNRETTMANRSDTHHRPVQAG